MADENNPLSAEEIGSFRNIQRILLDIIRHLEMGNIDSNMIDAFTFRLDWLHGLIIRYIDLYEFGEVVHLIGAARDQIVNHQQSEDNLTPTRIFLGDRGRPRYLIPREQLEFLLERCFSVVNIASLLGVSVRTIERRLSEFGLSVRSTYSCVGEQELHNIVRNILTDFPNTGYRRMTGFLQSRGLRIQQHRIREAMRIVNPAGVLLRALELRTIHRRRYQVSGPLALWHIDRNHKLIRYLADLFVWLTISEWATPFNNRTPLPPSRTLEFFRSKGYFALEFFRVETISTRNSSGVE